MPGGKELARICMGDNLLTEEQLFECTCGGKHKPATTDKPIDMKAVAKGMHERLHGPNPYWRNQLIELGKQWSDSCEKARKKQKENIMSEQEKYNKLKSASLVLLTSVESELEFVRQKYGIEGDNFSCPYFVDMAKKANELKDELKD